ncbi:hypothetical protein ZIOFF_057005 [Zingiber officinale]|uniref:Uncharacterized protein n=1 Tax=Zingiber officinale TaxID=94328 RepID=A0A8J5FYW3_ZINOF|nr:hypothetical protein ZIOFF_057005 [Zingiber officinale]
MKLGSSLVMSTSTMTRTKLMHQCCRVSWSVYRGQPTFEANLLNALIVQHPKGRLEICIQGIVEVPLVERKTLWVVLGLVALDWRVDFAMHLEVLFVWVANFHHWTLLVTQLAPVCFHPSFLIGEHVAALTYLHEAPTYTSLIANTGEGYCIVAFHVVCSTWRWLIEQLTIALLLFASSCKPLYSISFACNLLVSLVSSQYMRPVFSHGPPLSQPLEHHKSFGGTNKGSRRGRLSRKGDKNGGRGETNHYSKFVKPAFDDFILPTKKYTDIIIPRGGDNHVAIDLIVQHIHTKLGQHNLCKIYPNLSVIQSTFQIRGMHTLIRDAKTTTHDFIFYSDRLIRLVVEHGLGHLPFKEKQIITPTGKNIFFYDGGHLQTPDQWDTMIEQQTGSAAAAHNVVGAAGCTMVMANIGGTVVYSCNYDDNGIIAIMTAVAETQLHVKLIGFCNSGESMENALRACCKSIKIGKILIHREGDNGQQLVYHNLPMDIADRNVLLLDPILGTAKLCRFVFYELYCNSAVQAISLLLQKGVQESNIIFLNLISAPQGVHVVCKRFPRIKIVTSEIEFGLNEEFRVIPGMGEFGDRYFGTDDNEAIS